jgi:hypothetical protein
VRYVRLAPVVIVVFAFSLFGQGRQGESARPGATNNIGPINVVVIKKPQDIKIAEMRITDGQPFSGTLAPGKYVIMMSWNAPIRPNAKSFFESRSNVANIAAPGWQLTAGSEVGFAPKEWAQFERWPYAFAISGNGVKKGAGFIEQQGERISMVQEIVVPVETVVRAMVRPAVKAPAGPVNPNNTDAARPAY